MNIVLKDLDDSIVTTLPVSKHKLGHLYAKHPTFQFEVDCALYEFQSIGVHTALITDENDVPYIKWEIQGGAA